MSREIVHEIEFERLHADENCNAEVDAQGMLPFLVLTVSAAFLFCFLFASAP